MDKQTAIRECAKVHGFNQGFDQVFIADMFHEANTDDYYGHLYREHDRYQVTFTVTQNDDGWTAELTNEFRDN